MSIINQNTFNRLIFFFILILRSGGGNNYKQGHTKKYGNNMFIKNVQKTSKI
jgi:hypothetical protein